jgi:hypothetical protein
MEAIVSSIELDWLDDNDDPPPENNEKVGTGVIVVWSQSYDHELQRH